jgi:hypothetical protein
MSARVLPAHLESNFINPEYRGAQPADCLRTPEPARRSRDAAKAAGPHDPHRALVAYAMAVRGPGLALVLSDFLTSEHTFEGLRYLQYRGLVPAVVQILADEDIDPGIDEETEIRDVEDPSAAPLVVDAAAIRGYQEQLDRVTRDLRTFCHERGLPWLRVTASTPFADMLQACVHAGILAPHA